SAQLATCRTQMTARNPAITNRALRASASTDSASPAPRSHLPRDGPRWLPGVTLPDEPPPVTSRPLTTPCSRVNRIRRLPGPLRGSGDVDGALGQAEPEAVDDRARPRQVACGGAEGDEQRREVFRARMGQPRSRGLVLEVQQRVEVAVGQHLLAPVVELGH